MDGLGDHRDTNVEFPLLADTNPIYGNQLYQRATAYN
jgi:hypothetical protein